MSFVSETFLQALQTEPWPLLAPGATASTSVSTRARSGEPGVIEHERGHAAWIPQPFLRSWPHALFSADLPSELSRPEAAKAPAGGWAPVRGGQWSQRGITSDPISLSSREEAEGVLIRRKTDGGREGHCGNHGVKCNMASQIAIQRNRNPTSEQHDNVGSTF